MKASKYRNVRCELDGERFDSKKEMRRYSELLLLQKAGEIRGLTRQFSYLLQVNSVLCAMYRSDFVYFERQRKIADTWCWIVEDVKSPITRKNPVYVLKRKLMKAIHGIEIREM